MRTRSLATGLASIGWIVTAALAGACGGGGGGDGTDATDGIAPDAAPDPNYDIGFAKPAAVLQANAAGASVGAPDLSCLGTPTAVMAAATDITLATKVTDFEHKQASGNVKVTAFAGTAVGTPFDSAVTSASDGTVSVRIPAGTKLFGFKMTKSDSLDTLLLNQFIPATPAAQSYENIQNVLLATANTIPALVGAGDDRVPGTGVLAGAVRDCQAHELSNFIATVSSTRGTPTFLPGASTYYFANGLPIRHQRHEASGPDGLFAVLNIPPATTAYVQAWGYASAADLAAGQLTLVAEFATPVIAETVVTGSYRPLRTGE